MTSSLLCATLVLAGPAALAQSQSYRVTDVWLKGAALKTTEVGASRDWTAFVLRGRGAVQMPVVPSMDILPGDRLYVRSPDLRIRLCGSSSGDEIQLAQGEFENRNGRGWPRSAVADVHSCGCSKALCVKDAIRQLFWLGEDEDRVELGVKGTIFRVDSRSAGFEVTVAQGAVVISTRELDHALDVSEGTSIRKVGREVTRGAANPAVRTELLQEFHAEPLPTPAPPAPAVRCPPGMKYLIGGKFQMNEGDVEVKALCLDETEVTTAAYASWCGDRKDCQPGSKGDSEYCNWKTDRVDHPINCVTWSQADAYCKGQEKRLPKEEEWEWAARGGPRGWTYPWGNDDPGQRHPICWAEGSGTCSVGKYPRGDSPDGIHDLAGNVWEWTDSWYDSSRSARVVRGGSWSSIDAADVRASARSNDTPADRDDFVGFRCARTPF